tara:strand:- start:1058 stop:1756 length:699 start_codon:yes stop_codon:yes gene_type:complete
MIKYFTILILIPLWLPAQDSFPLTVNSGGLHVAADATLNIAGMELTPTSDYSFTVNTTNIVSVTNSSETVNDLETMSKVFGLQSPATFQGTLVYNYDESIMNGVSHDAALYVFDESSQAWSEYEDQDADDFTVTHVFDGSVSISKLTAGVSDNLSLDDNPMFGISVYPNPVSSNLKINGLENPKSSLYNIIGQLILTSNSKTINTSSLEPGTYFLLVKDQNNNQSNFKILKK